MGIVDGIVGMPVHDVGVGPPKAARYINSLRPMQSPLVQATASHFFSRTVCYLRLLNEHAAATHASCGWFSHLSIQTPYALRLSAQVRPWPILYHRGRPRWRYAGRCRIALTRNLSAAPCGRLTLQTQQSPPHTLLRSASRLELFRELVVKNYCYHCGKIQKYDHS